METMIPMCEIYADDDFNCRGKLAALDVVDLSRSIEKKGLIQPVVVTPEDNLPDGKKYFLVAGYRRRMAHILLKKTEIWAVIREGLSHDDAMILNLTENLDRKMLNILQEARALAKLKMSGLSEVDTAEQLDKSRGWVQIRFMLLEMNEEIQQEAAAGFLRQTDIRQLYTLRPEDRMEAAKKIKEAKQRGDKKRSTISVVKKNYNDKRLRNKAEIFNMMDHIQEKIGNNVATRAFAWCAGEINDIEFFTTLRNFNPEFEIPPSGSY